MTAAAAQEPQAVPVGSFSTKDDLLQALCTLKRGIVAIDGMCASGKSTLAGDLASACGASVFHMDDFFLRPQQRTPERLSEPGGNVDRERYLEEVLLALSQGEDVICYRRYDCHTRTLTPPIRVKRAPLVIVEGAYAMHPDLRGAYAFGVFLQLDPLAQRERIRARNGEAMLARFVNEWIPMENRYFASFQIRNACRFCIDTTGAR